MFRFILYFLQFGQISPIRINRLLFLATESELVVNFGNMRFHLLI